MTKALTGVLLLMLNVAVLAAGTGPAAQQTAAQGELIYQRCMGCHSLKRNRTGPLNCDLFGRTAGTVPGFEYSAALKASGIVWNEMMLDAFLTAPLRVVPGTSMGFAGIADARDRELLIAYLKFAGEKICSGNFH